MYVDTRGAEVEPIRPVDATDETIERVRDIIALRLKRRGISLGRIGQVLGMSRQAVHQRIEGMTTEAREYYGKLSLEGLFGAGSE